MHNIITCIESAWREYPERIIISDEHSELNYRELIGQVKSVASMLISLRCRRKPVMIFMKRSPSCISAMLGAVFSGNFYVVADINTPPDRIQRIIKSLEPAVIISEESLYKNVCKIADNIRVIKYEEAVLTPEDHGKLKRIRKEVIDTDPVYILYTSGSTGHPKGAVISHRALLSYTDWFINTFDISPETVFGSQAPLFFSMSVSDLYSALRLGGRYQMIPKSMFSFPASLVDYMNRNKINTIYWVPSALSLLAYWDTFSYVRPEFLKKILFAGEVLPVNHLNYWRKYFPDALYANLFGPTEATDICCYYIVDREFTNEEHLPLGRPCENCSVMIVNEAGKEAEKGELLVTYVFSHHERYSGLPVLTAILLYTFQLYMDFSGCIDIARGNAELFGIKLTENFRRPFFSCTVSGLFLKIWPSTGL